MITVNHKDALPDSIKYAISKGMTYRQIANGAECTEKTVQNARDGKPVQCKTWFGIIMVCGYVEVKCALLNKSSELQK